jgi:hypothetical protein
MPTAISMYGKATTPGPMRALTSRELINKKEVDGAVLDVHLTDGDVDPVASQLSILRAPFLFHCGLGLTPELKA